MRILALLMAVLPVVVAADIDPSAVGNPQGIELADRTAQLRFVDLFAPEPDWVSRQIAYLVRTVPQDAPTLLAARLCYRGEPWTRRGTASNPIRWRTIDREVRLACLREMRLSRDVRFVPVVRYLLRVETDPLLVDAGLATMAILAPDQVVPLAVTLADPRRTDALPGANIPTVRQQALALLCERGGASDPAAREALAWALSQARSAERNQAITILRRGEAPDLLGAAIVRLQAEHAAGELDGDGATGLALACVRIGSQIDAALAKALVAIAVTGRREIAAPAATALAGNVTWTASVPVADIARRAVQDPDPVIRHALANLLLRVNAKAAEGQPAASPWTRLAEHRARLEQWAWEEYVR